MIAFMTVSNSVKKSVGY